ncbi:MAG: helix-turn-helix transcriptional regulator [Pseudomonadota bacterium]|nr:hypothetical protein [Pseudomonadales bacterium]MDY6921023.1 helix-turn-helix transcriptional regulator [Pseudomonadota bacterium]|tara:strand:+ start:141 stop:611 length:471 start_codon:yes stop_codon:yes gene_type:complete
MDNQKELSTVRHLFSYSGWTQIDSAPRLKSISRSEIILKKIFDYVANTECLEGITVKKVASEIGVSERTLFRVLKSNNVTFYQLLSRERMIRCFFYLTHGPSSGVIIAERLGFSDPAYFYQSFKHWTGVSFRTAKNLIDEDSNNVGSIFNVIGCPN